MAYRSCVVSAIFLVTLVSCGGEEGSGSFVRMPPPGGSGGVAGMGSGGVGPGGSAGDAGTGGMAGSGGTAGTSGTAGSGGSAGSGGTGGTPGPCVTNALCNSCPNQFLCNSDSDCFTGWTCIPSGCETHGGAAIKQCQPLPASACNTNNDCSEGRECMPVLPGPTDKCVRTESPQCLTNRDCVLGFSCEGGSCVDRRVPCVLDDDCPVNHSCEMPTASNRFCVRVHQSCDSDIDCGIVAPVCVDIDGAPGGTKECAGFFLGTTNACVNTDCSGSAPVCEVSSVGSITACGQYGLCRDNNDCADSTYECLGLWPDGRKECVKKDGSCDHITDCPANQVCASPRTGGKPACQAGAVD